MIKIITTLGLGLLFLLNTGNTLADPSLAMTDQLIIKQKENALASQQYQPAQSAASNATHTMKLPYEMNSQDAETYATVLRQSNSDIDYIEPDRKVYSNAFVTPNDESYNKQAYYDVPTASHLGAINLEQAWEKNQGSANITIAIIDTGVTAHPDLTTTASGLPQGRDFIRDTQASNDGNGRDNNPSDTGDWISDNDRASNAFTRCTLKNSSWHGTHIAGIIGAQTNNVEGIAGINWHANLLNLRVMGKCGGYTSDVADAIRWAAGETIDGLTNSRPAHVINLSFGGSGACGRTEQEAIDYAVARGAIVVAAAGNNAIDASNQFPGNCNNVITVTALKRDGKKASFSNYGAGVDIAAPGVSILSTFNTGAQYPESPSYQYLSGTSMATAQVSGVVALMLASNNQLLNPDIVPLAHRAALIKQRLLQSSRAFDTVPDTDCTAGYCGQGMLDAGRAVEAAIIPPDEKIDLQIMQKNNATNGLTDDSLKGAGLISWWQLLFISLLFFRRLNNIVLPKKTMADHFQSPSSFHKLLPC